ncbi:MAG: hypothetical protein AAF192_05835, partial [Pseudomonadota bacterium]
VMADDREQSESYVQFEISKRREEWDARLTEAAEKIRSGSEARRRFLEQLEDKPLKQALQSGGFSKTFTN